MYNLNKGGSRNRCSVFCIQLVGKIRIVGASLLQGTIKKGGVKFPDDRGSKSARRWLNTRKRTCNKGFGERNLFRREMTDCLCTQRHHIMWNTKHSSQQIFERKQPTRDVLIGTKFRVRNQDQLRLPRRPRFSQR